MGTVLNDIKSAFRKQNNALLQLILINVLVFLCLILVGFILSFSPNGNQLNADILSNTELIAPFSLFIHKPWTLITYCFRHYDFWHLFSNMLLLYWFGNLIQEFIGSRKLVNIYLLGGLFSGIFYISFYNLLAMLHLDNHNIGTTLVGASAAAFTVMFAAITLLPEYEFYLFGLVMVKTRYLAWFLLLFSFINPSSGISHAGGALFGYLYIKLLQNGIDLGSPLEALRDWWKDLKKPKKPQSKTPRRTVSQTTTPIARLGGNTSNLAPDYFPDQDEIDAILDKIGKSGYESLTKEEKQKLYRASQKD